MTGVAIHLLYCFGTLLALVSHSSQAVQLIQAFEHGLFNNLYLQPQGLTKLLVDSDSAFFTAVKVTVTLPSSLILTHQPTYTLTGCEEKKPGALVEMGAYHWAALVRLITGQLWW